MIDTPASPEPSVDWGECLLAVGFFFCCFIFWTGYHDELGAIVVSCIFGMGVFFTIQAIRRGNLAQKLYGVAVGWLFAYFFWMEVRHTISNREEFLDYWYYDQRWWYDFFG